MVAKHGLARVALVLLALVVGYLIGCGAASPARREPSHSLDIARTRLAAEQSVALIEERFPVAPVFNSREQLLAHSLQSIEAPGGLHAEFGVASGRTINFLADQLPSVTFYGFDSFEGLPEDWRPGFEKGTFAMDALPEVRDNVELHVGWFDETLPGFLEAESGHVSFLHLDADLYSSTKTVLDALGDRLRPGSVIQFDEYFNYPGWKRGEFLAFEEFVRERNVTFEYLGYCDGGRNFEQVSVRLLTIGDTVPGHTPPRDTE